MADDPKPVEPTPDPNPAPVDPEKGKPTAYELELRKENEKLRKKYEAKLKEEEEARQKALEEQGKYKELYDTLKAEFDPIKAEAEQYRAQIQKEREALLEKLPEEKRAIYADAKIDVLRDVTSQTKPGPTQVPKGSTTQDERAWEQLSGEEQLALKKDDQPRYIRLYKDYYKRKNGIEPVFIP